MTALIGALLGAGFATLCLVIRDIANHVAQAFADAADRRAAAREATSSFCRDWIPDSGVLEPIIAALPEMPKR